MKTFRQTILGIALALGFMTTLAAVPAFAYDPIKDSGACAATPKPKICDELNGTSGEAKVNSTIANVMNILFYAIGIISVIMIVIGGLKYTTSNGDSTAVTSAKNTILYSVIGLVVALMAYAIVNFVIGAI